jgi:hypothetical protein
MKYLLTYIRSFRLKAKHRRSPQLTVWLARPPRYQAADGHDLSKLHPSLRGPLKRRCSRMRAFEQPPRGMARGLHRMVHLRIDGDPSTESDSHFKPTGLSRRPCRNGLNGSGAQFAGRIITVVAAGAKPLQQQAPRDHSWKGAWQRMQPQAERGDARACRTCRSPA